MSNFLKYESIPIYESPLGLKQDITVKKHQLQSLYMMLKAEESKPFTEKKYIEDKYIGTLTFQSRIGLLTNSPGSGKTLIILMLCMFLCNKSEINYDDLKTKTSFYSFTPEREFINVNIIIADNQILSNAWLSDLRKFFNNDVFCKVAIIERNKTFREQSIENIITWLKKINILLISRTVFHELFLVFSKITVNRIIFDELQTSLITNDKHFKNYYESEFFHKEPKNNYNELQISNFTWICSATPNDINLHADRYINKYIFHNAFFLKNTQYSELSNNYIINFPDDYILQYTNIPKPNIFMYIVKKSNSLELVEGIIDKDIIDIIKNDQLSEAIKKLHKDSFNLYDATFKSLMDKYNISQNEINILHIKDTNNKLIDDKNEEIEEISKKINELNNRYLRIKESIQINNCSICLSEFINPSITLCCSNIFCLNCITRSLSDSKIKNKCPLCKKDICIDQIQSYNKQIILKEKKENIYNNKLDALKQILPLITKSLLYIKTFKNDNAEENQEYLKKIIMLFDEEKITYVFHKKIDKSKINEQIKKFESTLDRTIWIMESEQASAGLSFPFVDSIITYDKYNHEKQIIGRMLRCGVTDVKNFFRIVYEETLDETIK